MNPLKNTFLAPPDEFSPIPFWFWNDELDRDELKRQLLDFYDKGIRGFVLHPRKGLPLTTPYLSEAFLDYVEFIVEEAEKLQMKVFLYDEAMYPSGSCGGQVVAKNPSFAAKGLQKHTYTPGDEKPAFGEGNWFVSAAAAEKTADGSVHYTGFDSWEAMMDYATKLTAPNYEAYYFTLVYSLGTIRGVHPDEDDGEPLAPKASDLLDKEAMETFISLTHDVYYNRLKKYFGTTVVSIFTDEPSIMGRNCLPGLIPWTHGFLDYYLAHGGSIDVIPRLFDTENPANHDVLLVYNHAVNALMVEHYFKPISDWCAAHGISLSGHPAGSEDIGMLKYFQLPCQDIVWRYIDPLLKNGLTGGHSTMGKCSSDAARHSLKRRNGNECFGACGHADDPWCFPFTEMKWYMNWLFARGVNLLIPHAFYYSLRDERVNERPPDVGPNSPWWDNYLEIATYIRRMSWINTDGVNMTDIAVLCNGDHLPWKPVKALYENQVEFNYLETGLLKDCVLDLNAEKTGNAPAGNVADNLQGNCPALKLAKQCYRAMIIEDGLLISDEEQAVIDRFEAAGGTIIRVAEFLDDTMLTALKQFNPLALKPVNCPANLRITHVLKEGMHFYLMINESEEAITFEATTALTGKKEIWNPWDGSFTEVVQAETLTIALDGLEALVLAVEA